MGSTNVSLVCWSTSISPHFNSKINVLTDRIQNKSIGSLILKSCYCVISVPHVFLERWSTMNLTIYLPIACHQWMWIRELQTANKWIHFFLAWVILHELSYIMQYMFLISISKRTHRAFSRAFKAMKYAINLILSTSEGSTGAAGYCYFPHYNWI